MPTVISALFDTRDAAETVATHLRTHDGVDASKIELHADDRSQPVETGGAWASLGHLLMPDSDRRSLSEAIRRGGTVLTAEVDESIAAHVTAVFNRNGAVDLEQRAATWREGGWRDDPEAASLANLPVNPSFALGAGTMAGTGVPMVDPEDPVTGPGSGLR